jgi:hypothetical protein
MALLTMALSQSLDFCRISRTLVLKPRAQVDAGGIVRTMD